MQSTHELFPQEKAFHEKITISDEAHFQLNGNGMGNRTP